MQKRMMPSGLAALLSHCGKPGSGTRLEQQPQLTKHLTLALG
jgi:hypothetical protein